jgi:hypothetical protein
MQGWTTAKVRLPDATPRPDHARPFPASGLVVSLSLLTFLLMISLDDFPWPFVWLGPLC